MWTHGESNPGLIHAMDACYHYTMGPVCLTFANLAQLC